MPKMFKKSSQIFAANLEKRIKQKKRTLNKRIAKKSKDFLAKRSINFIEKSLQALLLLPLYLNI